MRERISRRDFLRWGAVAMGGAALASCAPQAAPTAAPAAEKEAEPAVEAQPAPAEGVTVTFWWTWGQLDAAMERIVALDEFKDWTGNNRLEYKGSVAAEAFLTATAAGTPPDMGAGLSYWDFWFRGALWPVDDWVNASQSIKKDDFIHKVWENYIYKNQLIGVPGLEAYIGAGLNYNEKLVTEAGLDPDEPPVTWAECFEWHKALTEFDSAGNLLQMGLDPYDAAAGAPEFAPSSWGFTWWNEEEGTFHFDDPRWAESLDVMGEFVRYVGPDQLDGLRAVPGQGTWGGAFNAEVQAMILEGYWHPGETAIQKPEVSQYNRVTWIPVPDNRRGAKVLTARGHCMVLLKEGEHPYEAFRVAEYMLSDTALDILFEEVGWMVAKRSWLETVDSTAFPGLEWYIKAPNEATEWVSDGRCPLTSFLWTHYAELREKVYRDVMSASDAAKEMQRRVEAEWETLDL
jgi:maltose-binding protein MalE